MDDFNNMLDKERDSRYDERLRKVEKKLTTLYSLFFGYLFGRLLDVIFF